jgi:putative transposase
VLRSNPAPRKIVTDQLRSYHGDSRHPGAGQREARVRQGCGPRQQPREHERRMRGFRDPERTQAFLSSFGPIRQHFALKRHLLRASLYRKHLAARFAAWREFINVTQTPSNAF